MKFATRWALLGIHSEVDCSLNPLSCLYEYGSNQVLFHLDMYILFPKPHCPKGTVSALEISWHMLQKSWHGKPHAKWGPTSYKWSYSCTSSGYKPQLPIYFRPLLGTPILVGNQKTTGFEAHVFISKFQGQTIRVQCTTNRLTASWVRTNRPHHVSWWNRWPWRGWMLMKSGTPWKINLLNQKKWGWMVHMMFLFKNGWCLGSGR